MNAYWSEGFINANAVDVCFCFVWVYRHQEFQFALLDAAHCGTESEHQVSNGSSLSVPRCAAYRKTETLDACIERIISLSSS